MMKEKQHKRIWKFLEGNSNGLTTMEACYKLNITNLPKRISEMIALGYPISKTPEMHTNEDGSRARIMRYRMVA